MFVDESIEEGCENSLGNGKWWCGWWGGCKCRGE